MQYVVKELQSFDPNFSPWWAVYATDDPAALTFDKIVASFKDEARANAYATWQNAIAQTVYIFTNGAPLATPSGMQPQPQANPIKFREFL